MIALNRARATLQRVTDAKFFHGWVRRVTPETVAVRVISAHSFELGETFSFQVFGNRKNALFQAILVSAVPIGATPKPAEGLKPGPVTQELTCKLATKIRFTEATEQPRFSVEGVTIDLGRGDDFRAKALSVLDVGPGGCAVLTDHSLAKGDLVVARLFGYGVALEFAAQVRNCVAFGPNPELQRTGLQIKQIDRLNSAKWKQLYQSIVEDNRAHWAPEFAELNGPAKPKFRQAS